MKKIIFSRSLVLSATILLVFPSLYFVVSACLNYGLGVSSLWNLIDPIFEKQENKHLGLNINLLILFGPILAIIISLPRIAQLTFANSKEELNINIKVKKFSWSWIVVGAALFCLAAMGLYLIVENRNLGI